MPRRLERNIPNDSVDVRSTDPDPTGAGATAICTNCIKIRDVRTVTAMKRWLKSKAIPQVEVDTLIFDFRTRHPGEIAEGRPFNE